MKKLERTRPSRLNVPQTKLTNNQFDDIYQQDAETDLSAPIVDEEFKSTQGQPLDTTMQAFMEPRFGHDFSRIRVHADERAADVARSVDAQAFTLGQDIYFGTGTYQPDSPRGQAILAHELTHTIQQSTNTGPVPDMLTSLHISQSDELLEREAQAVTQAVGSGGTVPAVTHPSEYLIQRLGPNDASPDALSSPGTAREQIDAALKSKDVGDVKAIQDFSPATMDEKFQLITILLNQGWVGPFDEWALEAIWKSFGDPVLQVGATHLDIWKQCVDRGAELDKLPAVEEAKKKFLTDVETIARNYLSVNQNYIQKETERLGLQQSGGSPQQNDEIEKTQQAAQTLLTIQDLQAKLRQIPVGYSRLQDSGGIDGMPLFTVTWAPASFDPSRKPEREQKPGPEDREGLLVSFIDTDQPLVPWEKVNEQYEKSVALTVGLLNLQPALYALFGQDKQGELQNVAHETPEQARVAISQVMQGVSDKITETIPKIGGEIDSRDLIPIHLQLYGGMELPPGTSGLPWSSPIYKWIAQDAIGDYQAKEFWRNIGLTTLAAAAFVVAELATAGSATFFIAAGVGLGISVFQAGESWEKYLNMAQTAQANLTPETSLISQGQVNGALVEAVLNTVNVFISAYGPLSKGAGVASKATSAPLSEAEQTTQAALSKADAAITEVKQVQQALAETGKAEQTVAEIGKTEQALNEAEQKLSEAGKTEQALSGTENIEKKIAEIEEAKQTLLGVQQTTSGVASTSTTFSKKLLDKGFSTEALESLRKAGLDVSEGSQLTRQLMSAGDTTQNFINSFYENPGFKRVISNWAQGGYTQTGTRFVMKYCVGRLKGTSVLFEWPSGILETSAGGETWARYIDIVVQGGSKVNPGDAIATELKSWTSEMLAKSAGKVKFQLLRDTAMYGPKNVRWVFDGMKVSREEVLDTFLDIITKDEYLADQWGGSPDQIRQAIEAMIEVF